MVTLNGSSANYIGLHDDEKPETAAVNAMFLELDTGDFYYFNGTEWAKVGGDE